MFRNKTGDRQYKYSLRKIRGGGGAASFIIGAVIFGGLMTQPVVLADSTTDTTTSDTTTQPENISPTETVATEAASTTATMGETPTVETTDTSTTVTSATPVEKVEEEKTADATTEDSTKEETETTAPTRVRRSLSVPDEVDNTGKVISPGFDEKNVVTISRPVDYPNLPTYRDYNPNDYYIFKSLADASSRTTFYTAVKVDDSSHTIYLFNQYGQLIKAIPKGYQASFYGVRIHNYGDTYTIEQSNASDYATLSYRYSSDGEEDVVDKNERFNAITGVVPEKSDVIVKYVDEEGNNLINPVHKEALAGEVREIDDAPSIEGYVLDYTSGSQDGVVSLVCQVWCNSNW